MPSVKDSIWYLKSPSIYLFAAESILTVSLLFDDMGDVVIDRLKFSGVTVSGKRHGQISFKPNALVFLIVEVFKRAFPAPGEPTLFVNKLNFLIIREKPQIAAKISECQIMPEFFGLAPRYAGMNC